ncbi:MAG: hypothetical protein RR540_08910 [Oscillospiraceae bacterium]
MPNEITIMNQTFHDEDKNIDIPALVLVINGTFKKILEYIIAKSDRGFSAYIDAISTAIFCGNEELPNDMNFVNEDLTAEDREGKIPAVAVLMDNELQEKLKELADGKIEYPQVITDALFAGIDILLKPIQAKGN